MSNWDRRELIKVADTIKSMLKDDTLTEAQRRYLGALLAQAEEGSKTVLTSSATVQDISHKLCTFGRE